MHEESNQELPCYINCPICAERIYIGEEDKMDAFRHDETCSYSILDEMRTNTHPNE